MNAVVRSDLPKLTQSLLYLDAISVSFDGFRALNGDRKSVV